MSAGPQPEPPPLSRLRTVAELEERAGAPVTIDASEEECAGLAARFGLPAIGSVHAELTALVSGRDVHVTGEVSASVTQVCVVSLEPFQSNVREPVDVRFSESARAHASAPLSTKAGAGREKGKRDDRGKRDDQGWDKPQGKPRGKGKYAAAMDEPFDEEDLGTSEDPPDPIIDGRIDLGALVAEHVALALEPYPRKPGAEFDAPQVDDNAPASPFAVLGKLKGKE